MMNLVEKFHNLLENNFQRLTFITSAIRAQITDFKSVNQSVCMALIDFLRNSFNFSKSQCLFKAGDHVQPINGGPLMIVESVKNSTQRDAYIICCKWYDREQHADCKDVFVETDLKPFDWYHPD